MFAKKNLIWGYRIHNKKQLVNSLAKLSRMNSQYWHNYQLLMHWPLKLSSPSLPPTLLNFTFITPGFQPYSFGSNLSTYNRLNLVLTNTLLEYRMAHRSTWESPAIYGERERKDPYSNLIDYIIIRRQQRHTIWNSRSHNGLITYTDHRLVRTKFNLNTLTEPKQTHQENRPR